MSGIIETITNREIRVAGLSGAEAVRVRERVISELAELSIISVLETERRVRECITKVLSENRPSDQETSS